MRIACDGISVGCEVWLGGRQRYVAIALIDAWRTDGQRTKLLIWESRCAECGLPIFSASSTSGLHSPNRRCEQHRAPGRPVFPKRRRKV